MQEKPKIAVLISGRGSNLGALLKDQQHFCVDAVISDKESAEGLNLARQAQVRVVETFARSRFESKADQKSAIYERIHSLKPDLICLAGFMQIIEADFVAEFNARLINIHPSLLPQLPGLDTHRRALEEGLKIHGCSVHFVDVGMDTGPIIAQASCPVLPGDTIDELSQRVLSLEHRLYPWVVNWIAQKGIWLERSPDIAAGAVQYSDAVRKSAKQSGFIVPE